MSETLKKFLDYLYSIVENDEDFDFAMAVSVAARQYSKIQ